MKTVSIVIVSYHTGPVLWRSIESVLAQPELDRLILVDNGNPDDVRHRLSALAAKETRLTIITPPTNKGFAGGCNLGMKEVTTPYVLLLNPDCILPHGALTIAENALQSYPEAMMAGGCIVNPDNTEQHGSRRELLTPWIALVESFHLYRLLPLRRININDHPAPDTPSFVPAISGAFMFMKTDHYLELGGIDEGYFFHVEDLDFCFQVHKHGGKILYIPTIKIVHYRSSSEVSPYFVEWSKTKGFIRYFTKNFSKHYVPGFISCMIAALYLRFALRSLIILVKKNHSPHSDLSKRAAMLATYPHFAATLQDIIAIRKHAPIFLSGASGQVGLSILRHLLPSGAPITGLTHTRTIDFTHPNLTWMQGDLNSGHLNLDGITAKTLIYTNSIWQLPPLLDSFAHIGVKRLVCFSSTSVFTKANSPSAYEKAVVAKLMWAENEIASRCRKLGIEWTIFRPTLIYGVGLDKNISSIAHFIKRFGFFPIYSGKGLRQPVHVDDLAQAVISIIDKSATYGKSFNLCGGERLSYREMVGRIFDQLGMKRRIIAIRPLPLLLDIYSKLMNKPGTNGEIARRMRHDMVFDDSEAKRIFGYHPRAFLANGIDDLEPNFETMEQKEIVMEQKAV